MDLTPSDDQTALVNAARAMLAERMPTEALRATFARPSAVDQPVWSACAEMGWFSLGLPDDDGAEYGLADEALLLREAGRALAPGPLVATMVGARLAAVAGEAALSEQIAAGAGPVAAAIGGSADLMLVDAPSATHVLVFADDRADLYPIASFTAARDRRGIDEAARLSSAQVAGAPAATVRGAAAEDLALRASVLTAALLAGVSAGVRDMAVQHAKVREQFGAPIGVNQAVKHKCADMAVRTEAAECIVLFAALAVEEGRPDAAALVAAARVIASDAALHGARDNIQIHGGMGFTDESDAHLYLKRAHLLDRMFGNPAAQRRILISA